MINLNTFETVMYGLVIHILEGTVNPRQLPISVLCTLANHRIIKKVFSCLFTKIISFFKKNINSYNFLFDNLTQLMCFI